MKRPRLHMYSGGSQRHMRVNHMSNFLLDKLIEYPYVPLLNKSGLRKIPDNVIVAMKKEQKHRNGK